jgi:chromosome segregation ATPase
MEARVTRLEEDFEAIGTTVLETRAAVDRLEKGFAQNTKQLASLENRMASVETTVDRLETKVDRLETRFDGLETKVDGLETKVDGHTDMLQEILRRLPAAA